MKISEQAKQAAYDIRTQDKDEGFSTIENTIQTAIDSHERDLVEIAGMTIKAIESVQSWEETYVGECIDELKAALDRRKE